MREFDRMVGITHLRQELDVAEVSEAFSYQELLWREGLGLCPRGQGIRLIVEQVTTRSGALPVNPSGGALSTNSVGASRVIRAAEAALQLHGRGGKRPVPDVKTAWVSGCGVCSWLDVMILPSEL